MSSIAFETVKSQMEEKQKSMISGKRFSFSNIQTFGNLEIDFVPALKNVSDKSSILSESRYFLLRFWHLIKQF